MPLVGLSRIAGELSDSATRSFRAVDPSTGESLQPEFQCASTADVLRACAAADQAAPIFAAFPTRKRADFLRLIADRLLEWKKELAERAEKETALPRDRLESEIRRTARQLTLFADDLDDGTWIGARIEQGDNRMPGAPKPDHRSFRHPVGPVVVFGASNFPFAYSVAGCDTAAALAAGCPVIVKAHPAHPGVSALVGEIVAESVELARLPAGVFSLLFDDGHDIGRELVLNRLVRAVAFTGSKKGGRAIMDLAASRAEPIPVYAEMGACNPIFILPGTVSFRRDAMADALHRSCTTGAGQFCTKPGLIVVQEGEATDVMLDLFAQLVRATPATAMLSPAIHANYIAGITARSADPDLSVLAAGPRQGAGPYSGGPAIFLTEANAFRVRPDLTEEIFGPTTLVVTCPDGEDMLELARSLPGALAASVYAESFESMFAGKLTAILHDKVGRIVMNGPTTGVEVSRAIVHGGPYPATSDGRTSSVGATAIFRFTRRLCFQNCPDEFLPPELRDNNPLNLVRLVDGIFTSAPVTRRG